MKGRYGKTLGAAASIGLLTFLSPLIGGVAAYRWSSRLVLRWAFDRRWARHGKVGLLVYSDSPHWKDYFEGTVLPRCGDRLIVLNWSQRAQWTHSLEVLVFRQWAGEKDFNPIAILLRRHERPLVLRFRPAFRELKRGRPEPLRTLEEALLHAAAAA